MRYILLLLCLLLISQNQPLAQSETIPPPRVLQDGISIQPLLKLERAAFRLALNPVDGYMYALEQDGTIIQIDLTGTIKTVILPSDHKLTEVAGLAFAPDGTLFLSGNEVVGKFNIAKIQKAIYNPESEKWIWKLFAQTEAYPRKTGATFNHNVNALIVSPDGQYLFANSGSRTDHGEVRDNEGTFQNLRETDLTSIILRLPISPKIQEETIILPNYRPYLREQGFLFAEGTRNTFDLAFNAQGELFGAENSGDRDDPDELNWLQEGKHYGFPWKMGTNTNLMQFPNYDPSQDKLLNPIYTAATDGSYQNDPNFPPAPTELTDPIINKGPDADSYRDALDGQVKDASETGVRFGTFTPHRSPLGIIFDKELQLPEPFTGDGFILGWTPGFENSAPGFGPFFDQSQDVLHLELNKVDTSNGSNYEASVTRIIDTLNLPIDSVIIGDKLYVLDYGGHYTLWEISFTTSE